MADISTSLAGIPLKSCIFNAAGPHDETLEELETIAKSACPAIMMKSCTLEPREGNEEPRYKEFEGGSINSMGLPNEGYLKYAEYAKVLKEKYGKPIIASIAGLSEEDNYTIAKHFDGIAEIDIIELNASCPNKIGKPIVAYDPEAVEQLLTGLEKILSKPFGIKLPAYYDFAQYKEITGILNEHKKLRYVCSINSVANGLVIDPEKEQTLIRPKGGFGGIGGKIVKPVALANVRKMRELLREDIGIVGVGGIMNGKDVFEFILAGANAVQLATVFMQEGAPCFERVGKELTDYMDKKGYNSLEDFKGKLKVV